MKVILFDIDGTLILTQSAGQTAMEKTAAAAKGGELLPAANKSFAGRTDRSIVADHLQRAGIEDNDANYREYCEQFLLRLPGALQERNGRVLPGVIEALERLTSQTSIHLGLLTGNLRRAARMKLDHFDLSPYFYAERDAFGGFGDQHYHRDDVARAAMIEVRERVSPEIDPKDVWVIGDTPRDIQCARAIEANVVAVETGGYSREQLAAGKPDLLISDLQNADAWWDALGV